MNAIHLGRIAHLTRNPFQEDGGLEIIADGALYIDALGRIAACGPKQAVIAGSPNTPVIDHGDAWLIPGLIDGHIHFPQFYATASYGEHLLDWLTGSIFPQEQKFEDPAFSAETAGAFVAHLLAHGTTTALVFGSQFPLAMRALFDHADAAGLRLITGLTLMDRDAPASLLTTPKLAYDHSRALMKHIAANPLLHYAVTPRFALSCTHEMLEACGQLKRDEPGAFVQTHINENLLEIEATRAAFPEADHYLDVYARAGLLCQHTVLAHSIHSSDAELALMAQSGVTACHCPCSNLYLGSGLFPLKRHLDARVSVMVGTDIGGGGHFSILSELAEVYKVQQMNQFTLDAARLLYLGTLGGAVGLGIEDETGNLEPGKSADFLVLSAADDAYLSTRLAHCESLEQQLFVLLNRASGPHIIETHVAGRRVSPRS